MANKRPLLGDLFLVLELASTQQHSSEQHSTEQQ